MRITLLLVCLMGSNAFAEDSDHQCRLLGLFQPDRADDLRMVIEKIPDIALVKVDFKTAIATLRFDAKKVFPNAKTPAQLIEQISQKLRGESQGVIEALPLSTIPPEKLKEVKISIVGLDCKGCSYAAYIAVYKIEGVEYATANFHDGLVFARIDPEKTNRAALEEALTKKRVALKDKAKDLK